MISKTILTYTAVGIVIFGTIAAFVSIREQATQSGRTWEETRRSMARSYNIVRGLRHQASQTSRPDFSEMNAHLNTVEEKSGTLMDLFSENQGAYTTLQISPQILVTINETTKELNRLAPLFQKQFLETAGDFEELLESIDHSVNSLENSTALDQERALNDLRWNIAGLGNLSQSALFDVSLESKILTVEKFMAINPDFGTELNYQVEGFLNNLNALKDITESLDNIELELSAQGTTLFEAINDATEEALAKTNPFFALVVIQLLTLATIFFLKSHKLKKELIHHNEELEGLVKVRTNSLELAMDDLKESTEKQKKIEEELLLSHRLEAIGQLAAGIAHEINTPSQFVNDNLQFMLEAHKDLAKVRASYAKAVQELASSTGNEKLLEDIQDIEDEVDLEFLEEEVPSALQNSLEGMKRISKIVKSMKDFSHPGTEGRKPIDLNKAVETTLSVARNEWKYTANIEKNFAEDLPEVPIFASELNQVLLNIIVNAAQAISEKNAENDSTEMGTIHVQTGYDDNYVDLRIRDSGCGIPQKNIDRVFDPFFTTKEVGKGTGQGLSIARKIVVDQHDGVLNLSSKVGQFTEFHIRLPRTAKTHNASTIGANIANQTT